METQKTVFTKVPSWLLALLIAIIAVISLIISDSIWTPRSETGLNSHLINDLIIALGCFFIVRRNPKSIWYVPIICNATLLLASFFEPDFWKSSMVITICGGWLFSVFVSIIAARQGNRILNKN